MIQNTQIVVVVVLYFACMLVVGLAVNKKSKNADDFFIAKNKLGGHIIGFSYAATNIGGGAYMGAVGTTSVLGYNFGPSAVASAMSPWVVYSLVGGRIRRVLNKIRCITTCDLLGERYYSKKMPIVASVIVLLTSFPVLSTQFQAAATSFEVILGVPYMLGVFLFGGIVVVYTVGGGMFAVAWTDFIQGLLMIIGYFIMVPVIIYHAGGISQMHATFAELNPQGIALSGLQPMVWALSGFVLYAFLQVGGSGATMARFLMTSDEKEFRKSSLSASLLSVFMFVGMLTLGIAGAGLVTDLRSSDMLLPALLTKFFPPIISGVILAAVMGAMMSTTDSLLINGSALVVNNIMRIDAKDEKKSMRTAQIATFVIGLASLLIAIKPPATIIWLGATGVNVAIASLTAPIMIGLWWPRATREGGWAGMLGGCASSIFWYALSYAKFHSLSNYLFGIWPGILGTLVSVILIVAVSKLTPAPPKEVMDVFFDDIEMDVASAKA